MGIKTIHRVYSILLIVLLAVQFSGCNKKDNENPGSQTSVENTEDTGEYILPTLSERTEWNIEMKYLSQDDRGIWITIIDYDNQGFQYNPLYYVLEKYDGSEWVKLTKMNESNASRDYSYVFPSKKNSYIDTNNLNYFSLLPSGTELETGRYRLTKVLSGKEFSVEFDYTTN